MSRYLLVIGGVICVAIAVVTFPIPGVPSSAFLLLGGAMLARSSPALEQRLREHRWLGSWIRRIEEMPRRQIGIVLMVWVLVLVVTGWLTWRAVM
ncbi:MAG: DUF454 family protein [Planctomycetaceae bacterium]